MLKYFVPRQYFLLVCKISHSLFILRFTAISTIALYGKLFVLRVGRVGKDVDVLALRLPTNIC